MKTFAEKINEIYKGINLEQYVHDEDWNIRVAVAWEGAFLDVLKNDEYWFVRAVVALQGAYLDELKDDVNENVSNIALQKLKEKENENL